MTIKIILSCFLLLSCWGCAFSPATQIPPALPVPSETLQPPTAENGNSKETLFQTLIPVADMNRSILFSTPENLNNDFHIGNSLVILVENTTEYDFIHPYSMKPEIYAHEAGSCSQIENFGNYIDPGPETIEPSGFSVVNALPKPLKYDEPIEVRIVVVGDLVDENGNVVRTAGAYIDVLLEP